MGGAAFSKVVPRVKETNISLTMSVFPGYCDLDSEITINVKEERYKCP